MNRPVHVMKQNSLIIERPQHVVKNYSPPFRAVQIQPHQPPPPPPLGQVQPQLQSIKLVQPMNFQRPKMRVINAANVNQPRPFIVNPQIV